MSRALSLALLATAAFAASAHPALAAEPTPLEACVELSPGHQGVRYGSKYLLLKDGDAHYRVDFGRSCNAIAMTSEATIESGGQANHLCPADTKVSSKHGSCTARKVETIDAATFARYAKRRR